MDPIREIRERISGHSSVQLNEQKNFIEAIPDADDGFSVSLLDEGNQFTVTYGGGWHEHFNSSQDALKCFEFGLSERCRLKIHMAGKFEHKWIVEYFEDGDWLEDTATGLLFYPFWRAKQVLYRQNRITALGSGDRAS